MKFRNILLTTFAASAFVIGTTSCSDSFLDEKMYSSYGPEVSDVNAKLVGLHRQYAAIWGMSSQQGFVGCWQVGTDVGAPGDTQGVEVPFYRYQELNAENAGVSFLWEKLYELINSANQIIASQAEGGDAAATAEAMFFRAYAYNMLVTLWGDVPLVTESTSIPRTDYTRNAVAEVDGVIDSDLVYAMSNLPVVGAAKNESRINQDMARQLAGEAYLRMGMRDASYFKKAEDAVTPIITGGKYELISARYGKYAAEPGDYYHDMFRWGNQRRSQGNMEAIWTFEMEYNRDVNGGTIDNPQQRRNWVPAFHKLDGMVNADSIGGRGNGRLRISNFVKYGLYEKGDIRNSNYNIRRVMWYNKPGFSKEVGIDLRLMGLRDDIPQICKCADIGVMPSTREGLGLSGIEMLAAGLPVIASNVHGIVDYVTDDVDGYLCDPFDENVFAKAISKLADENLRKSMIENCEKAAEPFEVEHSKKAMQDISFKILN